MDPDKFFIGVIDLFSVILPGAVLSYILKDDVARRLAIGDGYPLDSTEHALVFAVASYLAGHVVFLFGASLDNLLYDPLRRLTHWGQIGRAARGQSLQPAALRRFASRWLFGPDADRAVMVAQRMKATDLADADAAKSINTFQWVKARLSLDHPAGLAAVQRFEADSKFFRSFIVVLIVLALYWAWQAYWHEPSLWARAAWCALGLVPAVWRYVDQRFKATEQAYRFAIAARDWTRPLARPRKDALTHAGGVVTRYRGGTLEVLLVQASGGQDEWLLPKGHIEPGEKPAEAAVREVLEETGWWAAVEARLADQLIPVPNAPVRTRFFRMRLLDVPGEPSHEHRQQRWLTVGDAIEAATFPETRELLRIL